jgi:hypothetical protein
MQPLNFFIKILISVAKTLKIGKRKASKVKTSHENVRLGLAMTRANL